MVAVISNYFSVQEQGEKNWSNITFVSGDMEPDGSWFRHTKRALYHRVAERVLNKSSLLSFDFCVKMRLCYSINDDVTLRFFWFNFTIFFRIRNDTRHGVLAVFVWNFCCCFFCPVLVVAWCACRGFLFLFCSFLVNFTNLSWKEFNIIIILIYWVRLVLELYYYLRCFSFFLFMFFCCCFRSWSGGRGGCISSHKKDRGLRQHTINYICTSLLHLVFPFPPTLIAVSECDV